ncbi:MAG TPA: thioesterase family protein [Candidatus Acidoferrum sp.]|jgi:acyl-CoA thioester hydrolase|nr:thioesterase family protein [Candidatus Acidoferrum sp.]
MPYEFKVTRRVEFSETDMAGIMHFSNFFRFMETAEGAFFRSLGYSVALSRKGLAVGLPRVHAECDYMAPLRFEDEVLVHLLVEKRGTRSLTYQFRFYLLNGRALQPVARGRLTAVCVARRKDKSMKAVTLPPALAQKIQIAPPGLLAEGSPPSESSLSAYRPVAKHPLRRAWRAPADAPAAMMRHRAGSRITHHASRASHRSNNA